MECYPSFKLNRWILYLDSFTFSKLYHHRFIECDKAISRFVWKRKRPRICYKTLQLSKEKGGWAFPSQKNYFISAQIRMLLNWCDSECVAKWKEIECSMFTGVPLQAIIADTKRLDLIDKLENNWVKSILTTWK